MAALFLGSKFSATDANGNPLAGGKVYTYSAGTLTPKATYTTQVGDVANANPVILDSAGRANIWLGSGAYKFVVQDSTGAAAPDGTVDNVTAPANEVLGSLAAISGAGLVNTTAGLTDATTRSLEAKARDRVSLADFGAVGDGNTNDTTAIAAALASGADLVYGVPGCVYLVRHTSAVVINTVDYRYCVRIPSGVVLDGQGATFKSDGAQNSSVLAMFSGTDSGLVNAVIDCNKSAQTAPATGEIAGLLLYNNTRPVVDNVRAINCRQYAGRFLGNTGGQYDRLWCTDSDADGWSFGTSGVAGELREFDTKIGRVHAESCTQVYGGGYQGNPVIVTAARSQIDQLSGKNCAGGLKIQDMTDDLTAGALLFTGGANGTANSGVKVQGNNGASVFPKGVNIGRVVVSGCYGNGLRVTDVESCAIGAYAGRNNGSGAAAAGSDEYDVYIDTTNGTGGKVVQIGSMCVDTPGTVGVNTLGAGNVQIGTWFVRGCTGAAFLDAMSGGTLNANQGRVVDVGSALTWAFRSTGSADGNVGPVDCSAAHSTGQSRATVAAGNYNMSVGPIRLAGGSLEGIVTLSAGASTSVANASVWRDYIGAPDDYFHPEIEISPIGATARALGSMYAVVTNGSSSTGFAIKHAAAAGTEKVRYRIGPMSVWSAPTA